MAYDYQLLKVQIEGRIAWVTISNPPINVITLPLYAELSALSKELKADPNLTVVVPAPDEPVTATIGCLIDMTRGLSTSALPRGTASAR